jgi:hypothetical protein
MTGTPTSVLKKEISMKRHELMWAGGALVLGLLIGTAVQRTDAQVDSCQGAAAWDVRIADTEATHGTWGAVKFNKCTGETLVLGMKGKSDGRITDEDKWLELLTERVKAAPR